MLPALATPRITCRTPANATAAINFSNEPSEATAAITIEVNPAAGPLTLSIDPLNAVTISPPTIPANRPEKRGTLQASAIPRHKGRATKNTTIPDLIFGSTEFIYKIRLIKIKIKPHHQKDDAQEVLFFGRRTANSF